MTCTGTCTATSAATPAATRAARIAALALLLSATLSFVAPPPAHAGVQIAGSVGEGMVLNGGVSRSRVNFEVLPSYGFGPVSADLGFVFHLEDQVDLLLRPGARVDLWVLYARLAFPLKVTSGFDWGVLVGAGVEFLDLAVLSLFVEVDASFYDRLDFHEAVPLEFRLGVELGF